MIQNNRFPSRLRSAVLAASGGVGSTARAVAGDETRRTDEVPDHRRLRLHRRALIDLITERGDAQVVNLDVKPPPRERAGSRFVRMDIRDRGMDALLEAERPDALVHLAFVLNPMRDEQTMYDIDVNGTQNVLDAASRAGVPHVLVASSTTAYGAWPDNPVPLTEEHPVRGMPDYEYARDKPEIDRISQLWAARHPDRTMTIVRPTIVFGPNVDNYIIRFWTKAPFIALIDGVDLDMQYVHEDDVVDALSRLLLERRGGVFNLTGDGTVKMSESARLAGLKTRNMPHRVYRRIAGAMWKLRMPNVEAPPGQLRFARYPWIASNEKLKAELGWTPRYTSRETFEIALRAKGVLGPEPSPQQTPAAPPAAPVAG
jgi:UDP-glucose 4-epimerase